jgi:hypothetical protein
MMPEINVTENDRLLVDAIRDKVNDLNVMLEDAANLNIEVKLSEIRTTTVTDFVERKLYSVSAAKVTVIE